MSSCTASPSGVATLTRFDQAGQLAGATTVNSSTQLFDLTYTRDANGNLASSTPTVGTTTGPVDSFNYDQQTQVSSGPSTTGSSPTPYAYTQNHGITQAPGFGAAKYSASGQLCWTNATSSSNPCGTPPSGATAYGYDGSGDRLSGGATNTLGWNQESSQLCYSVASGSGTCAAPPTGASTYTYDSTGRRTSETASSWTGTFTWDQANPSLLSDGTTSFLYGPSGSAPIEQITGSGTGAVADLLISDQIGNTRGLVRISGSSLVGVLTNTTDYDAYGNAIVGQGQAAEPGGVSTQETALNTNYVDSTPFGYGSGYTDPSGLVYLVHRYYDPVTGQFVSQDPLVDQTASPYGYAGGNPVGGVDPLGLWWCLAKGASGPCQSGYTPGPPYNMSMTETAYVGGILARCESANSPNLLGIPPDLTKCVESALPQGLHKSVSFDASSSGIQKYLRGANLDFSSSISKELSKQFKEAGQTSKGLAREEINLLQKEGVNLANSAKVLGLLGAAFTMYDDTREGHNILYAGADAAISWGAGAQGFVRGAMICLGPDNPVALICGGIGAAIMGGLAHWSYSKIMGWF